MSQPRPSDVYGHPAGSQASPEQPDETPQPRRRWPTVAGVVFLLVVGIAFAATPERTPDGPVVDVVSEDQAVAALGVYRAQAEVLEDLSATEDIFASPGPPGALQRTEAGIAEVEAALEAARAQPNPDRLAATYWHDPEHEGFLDRLRRTAVTARRLALLAATHDSIYGGAGTINLQEAQHRITSEFQTTTSSGPLAEWARTLLREIDGEDRSAPAAEHREEARALWPQRVDELHPLPAEQALGVYVDGLPRTVVDGLRGHPVAAPALQRLQGR